MAFHFLLATVQFSWQLGNGDSNTRRRLDAGQTRRLFPCDGDGSSTRRRLLLPLLLHAAVGRQTVAAICTGQRRLDEGRLRRFADDSEQPAQASHPLLNQRRREIDDGSGDLAATPARVTAAAAPSLAAVPLEPATATRFGWRRSGSARLMGAAVSLKGLTSCCGSASWGSPGRWCSGGSGPHSGSCCCTQFFSKKPR
ncbi:unnamed protein product [Cuscuta campestris]|uniref:Uncharacterized protein n=1 Tax=Cuscuta campestris TaxID=132261 RepID=A0A484K7V3_9ASTE|nr:unnamed protein product [Cuscuta campestris]